MEDEVILEARKLAGAPNQLLLGIGDDAAVLDCHGENVVVTVDMLTDGVDFLVGQVEPEWIGRKSLAANLSDLAAMGAFPHSIVVSVALPRTGGTRLARGVLRGIADLAREFDVALAGGDTNSWDGKLVVSITAFGLVAANRTVLTRAGARPGDRILVTGRFGGSMPRRQFQFIPRVSESLLLNDRYRIHAAMDVSDGLLLDLTRMATAGRVGFTLDEASVPIHNDAFACCRLARNVLANRANRNTPDVLPIDTSAVRFPFDPGSVADPLVQEARAAIVFPELATLEPDSPRLAPLTRALEDGEDFELILAVAEKEAVRILRDQPLLPFGTELTDIGSFDDSRSGFRRCAPTGELRTVDAPGGFKHDFQ